MFLMSFEIYDYDYNASQFYGKIRNYLNSIFIS